jgi:hypothetical protein
LEWRTGTLNFLSPLVGEGQSKGETPRGGPLPFPFFLLISCLAIALFSATAARADSAYLADLLQRSAAANLSAAREWHLLLHYRANVLGGYTSEIDDPHFFLAPHGKTDPQAELEATLSAFFSTAVIGDSQQPAQCAFIARYHWLRAKLAFDDQSLPPQPCEQFQEWLRTLDAASITLVFPSAYMHNPASLFGHIFLRIDQKGRTAQSPLLGYALNYSAHTGGSNPFEYVVYGIGGGFEGDFSLKPYYKMVKEYGDLENRDIWEYRLSLSDEQLQRLLMHVWELENSFFDYFFFKENCAYHIIALLEVADPQLHFTDRFRAWTVPADTVRFLAAQPGLIKQATYRPAPGTQLQQKWATLSPEERTVFTQILRDPNATTTPTFTDLAPARQAFLVDLAIDYLQYQRVTKEKTADSEREQIHTLLLARSRLPAESAEFPLQPFVTQPDLGHGSLRVGFGPGWQRGDWFTEFSARAGYHDLLDPDRGYTPDAQIAALDVRLRHYPERERFHLERLTLVDMLSLSPLNSLLPAPSWKVRAALDTTYRKNCRYCHAFTLNGGLGIAVDSRWLRRTVYFVLPELAADFGHAFTPAYRLGGGGTVGTLAQLTDRWKILASGTYRRYRLGNSSSSVDLAFGQSYALRRNWVLRAEFHHRGKYEGEVVLQVQVYF